MMFMIKTFSILCIFCSGIFYLARWHLRRRRLLELASQFQGPPALPIVGNAHMFMGNAEDLLTKTDEMLRSYPSPCRLWLGPLLSFLVTDPEQISEICLSPKTLAKSKVYVDHGRPLFGTGILIALVSKWRVHRKLIQPTFHPKILESFVEIFAAQSEIFTKQIERNLDGSEFQIFKELSLCTLDMVCETAMGVEVGAQTKRMFGYVEALHETLDIIVKRFFLFWLQADFIFYRTRLGKIQQKHTKYLHEFADNVIRMKRNELLERQRHEDVPDNGDMCYEKRRREAFLDHLIKFAQENDDFSYESLRDEVITMILAGNDTSAVATSFAMLMLASYPAVQERVYEELYEIYGDVGSEERPVVTEDLSRMKYLERVIKETLRLFPVGTFILREVTAELNIGAKYTFPVGSTIALAVLSLHRNERYWPEPLQFDPDRFLPEENAKRHPYAYLAFSAGPRNCIGVKYAMMSVKTLLATILRKYILKKDKITPIKDIRLRSEFLITPVDPITLRIERRNGTCCASQFSSEKTKCFARRTPTPSLYD